MISKPGTPSGETSPTKDVSYTYTTSGATSNLGHTLEYSFDWGDGTSSSWSTSKSASHSWSTTGSKTVTVIARCQSHNDKTNTSDGLQVNVIPSSVNFTLNTNPISLAFKVDDTTYTAPHTFTWVPGGTHTLNAQSPQETSGARYIYDHWSDGGAQMHSITVPSSDTSYTAYYIVSQYFLMTAVNDTTMGSITPSSPGAWYMANTMAAVTAIPKSGYYFSKWSGDLSGSFNPDTLLMDKPKSVTAHFKLEDILSPYLVNCFPPAGASAVPTNTDVQFSVIDDGYGVDLFTLDVYVNSTAIILDGVDQTGGLVRITSHSLNYKIHYDPSSDFADESSVTVLVQCQDLASPANSVDSTYTFNIGSFHVSVTKTDTIDQTGGIVTDDSTDIQISIPYGALKDTTQISIGVIEELPTLPDTVKGISLAYYFGPNGLQFADSVTIRIPYTQADLDSAGVDNPMNLPVYYYSTTKGDWTLLTIANADIEYVYVKVMEFCYLVFVQKVEEMLSKPGIPIGETQAKIDSVYTYCTTRAISNFGSPLEYCFNWDDGSSSPWSPDTTASHKWHEIGTYALTVIVRNQIDISKMNTSDTLFVKVGLTGIQDELVANGIPKTYNLKQNYPNPFNPTTQISFDLPKASQVTIEVYNLRGQKVRTLVDGLKEAGSHSIQFDATDEKANKLPTGIYLYIFRCDEFKAVKKLAIVK